MWISKLWWSLYHRGALEQRTTWAWYELSQLCDGSLYYFFFTRLKDDDSGDHDQNEENNTQKDSEKEKNDREKPQSTTKRKVRCWHLHFPARAWCGSARESILSSGIRKMQVSVHCYCCSEDRGAMFDFSNFLSLLEVSHLRDECSLH